MSWRWSALCVRGETLDVGLQYRPIERNIWIFLAFAYCRSLKFDFDEWLWWRVEDIVIVVICIVFTLLNIFVLVFVHSYFIFVRAMGDILFLHHFGCWFYFVISKSSLLFQCVPFGPRAEDPAHLTVNWWRWIELSTTGSIFGELVFRKAANCSKFQFASIPSTLGLVFSPVWLAPRFLARRGHWSCWLITSACACWPKRNWAKEF